MTQMPLVSVIIPSCRFFKVEETIESIKKQDFPTKNVEIILVGKDTAAKGADKIISGRFYPGKARNLGARVARGEYFLFIDDDCQAEKNWIRENLRALQNRKVGAVSGMVIGKSDNFFARCIDFSNFDLCQVRTRCERAVCSASMGVRREVFLKEKGFEEKMRVGEDIEFCYRLIDKGYKTIYEPKIKVFHDHKQNSLRKIISYMYFGGRNSGLQFQKKYSKLNFGSKVFSKLQSPYLFSLFILLSSLLMSIKSLFVNFREHKKVIFYFPFIFLAKLSYNMGILVWILKENNKSYARKS